MLVYPMTDRSSLHSEVCSFFVQNEFISSSEHLNSVCHLLAVNVQVEKGLHGIQLCPTIRRQFVDIDALYFRLNQTLQTNLMMRKTEKCK
jgi:hypothetical protein